jgi:hypothetical protein
MSKDNGKNFDDQLFRLYVLCKRPRAAVEGELAEIISGVFAKVGHELGLVKVVLEVGNHGGRE